MRAYNSPRHALPPRGADRAANLGRTTGRFVSFVWHFDVCGRVIGEPTLNRGWGVGGGPGAEDLLNLAPEPLKHLSNSIGRSSKKVEKASVSAGQPMLDSGLAVSRAPTLH